MTLESHAARWRDMEPHVQTLSRLAAQAQTVVEFGVRTGVSTWAILDGLPASGRLVSVDIQPRDDVPERILTDPRWQLVVGDDRDEGIAAQLPKADLVFIDTSHEYHHTLYELTLAASLCPTRIALHDFALPDVADAVLGFTARTDWRMWLLEPSEWGFVVLSR